MFFSLEPALLGLGDFGVFMLSATLFLVAFSGLILSRRLLGDYFSPPAIYNFFWTFSLGCLELNWVAFDPLGTQVWQVIALSYFGFMGGAFWIVGYCLRNVDALRAPPQFEHLSRTRFETALKVLFTLGILGFLVQLAHLQSQFGLTTFLSHPQIAREQHTNVKYIGLLNLLNVANFALSLMYLTLYKRPRKWVLLILIWALATTLMTTDRTRFFYMVIWSFYVVVYLMQTVRLRPRILAFAGLTVLTLFGFFLLIAKMYKKQAHDTYMSELNISQDYASLIDPYIYLTGSFPVLQAFLKDRHDFAYGTYTFSPVVKIIELVVPDLERVELAGTFYRVPIDLNACTYLEPFYKDFGMVGILVGPFLIGLLATWVWASMRHRRTLFSVYLASLLSFTLTISIFVNHFTQLTTWYFVGLGYLVYRYTYVAAPQDLNDVRRYIYEG